MSNKWPAKKPGETIDFGIDWTNRLPADDEVSSVVWSVPSPLVKESQPAPDDDANERAVITRIFVSGGVDGAEYEVTATMTSTGGRVLIEAVALPVRA